MHPMESRRVALGALTAINILNYVDRYVGAAVLPLMLAGLARCVPCRRRSGTGTRAGAPLGARTAPRRARRRRGRPNGAGCPRFPPCAPGTPELRAQYGVPGALHLRAGRPRHVDADLLRPR